MAPMNIIILCLDCYTIVMSSIRFQVIVLTLLTISMYKKIPKKINTSHPLIYTYMCLLVVRNVKFSITFSKTFTIIGKEYPYLEKIDSKQIQI